MSFRRRHDLRLVRQPVEWPQGDGADIDSVRDPVRDYRRWSGTDRLIDDVHLSIMPYRGSRVNFEVVVAPADEGVEAVLADSVGRRNSQGELPEAVSEFVRECAAFVMAFGNAAYEIAYWHDKSDKPISFMLIPVQSGSVQAKGHRLVQYIPTSLAREKNLKGGFIELSPEHFVVFDLPACVRSAYEPMMDALAARSDEIFPEFAQPVIEGTRVPFDIEHFDRTKKMARAQASKVIGWDGRFLIGSQDVTEYYKWHRLLLFERFKIELRDGIIATLNNAISRAGRRIGFAGQLEVKGLPTLTDVRDAQEALLAGSKSFGEILGIFRFV